MAADKSNNKTIAKNTMFLYFRMMVTMVISLYTSRVVLQVLGVDDYGIYKTVGGIVGFLGFLNSALGTGASRFITYGLGEGNIEKLKRIFSTTLTAHVCLALIIILVAETIGLWFLHNQLVIPADRMDAAILAFHISIVSVFFTLTQVPFNACIIAHERMTVFAYVSIFEALAKLLIVYLLPIGGFDKLKFYALLLCLLQVGILTFYRLYCMRRFEEARLKLYIDKSIFKEIASFSGWSLMAGLSRALNNQGILVLLNMFFSPAVVAARAISIQVNMHASQLVSSFQTAANPQIVKKYAAKDYDGSKKLLLQTTCISFYLMLLVSLPICLAAEPLLKIWLGIVPEYTVIFLQLIVIQGLFEVFDTSFYRALYAKGQLKENAMISPSLGLIRFPIIYLLFKWGFSPVALSWASLITYAILGLVIKPILLIKIVNYHWRDILSVFLPCAKVTLMAVPVPLMFAFYMENTNRDIFSLAYISLVSVSSVSVSSWFGGLSISQRQQLKDFALKNVCKKRKS